LKGLSGDPGRLPAPRPRNRRRPGPAGHRSACAPEHTAAAVEYVAAYPGIHDIIAKGENKVSFHLSNGLQVDVRLLPSASYGAALQYFTGSKAHNVSLRQRALKMGYTLSEWALARLDDDSTVAAATEEEIYAALGMDWMPPELRENLGEIEAAARHALPRLIEQADMRGDLHMHTTPPTATTPSARWPRPPRPADTSTSPSPTTPRTWP
jgi:DNA polymerase (family X)